MTPSDLQVTSDLCDVAAEDRVTFWRQCSRRFSEKQLSRTEAVVFFRRHAQTAGTAAERWAGEAAAALGTCGEGKGT